MADIQSSSSSPLEIDYPSACLRRAGLPLQLRPKSFDVLAYLSRNRGRLVSKAELIDHVWGHVAVTENSLVQCIKDIRQVLNGNSQFEIKTVPKRGYVFEGRLAQATDRADESNAGEFPALPDRPSIAVLPFENLSEEPDQEHFADGVTEDLITGLSRIKWLFVIARNSTFIYKDRPADVSAVGRELGVRYLLRGSIRRAAKRLRISAQLIEAQNGLHHWAEQYDRELGDIFDIQNEIARNVVGAIEPFVLAAESTRAYARSAQDLGAWELVARARTHVWRLNSEDNRAAIEALQRTVDAYPDYEPARSLLGFCLVFAAHNGWIDPTEGMNRGREHTLRAIELDHRTTWGPIALGYLRMMEKRTVEAIAAFETAVRLNPNSAAAHCYLSRGLAFSGRDREAIEHAETAIRLSPMDPEMALVYGCMAVAHYTAGRYDQTLHYTGEVLRLRPGFQGAQRLRCAALAQLGMIDEARQYLEHVRIGQPQLTLQWIRESVPYQTAETMERFVEGMRKAGVREV
jgi:TolB-like protein/Flp pilus assembly protein TadD